MKGRVVAFLMALLLQMCFPSSSLALEQIKVGVYQNSPKLFVNEQGRAAGFYVDLLDAVALKEAWPVQYVPCVWQQCLEWLADGQIDLLPDIAFSEVRAERFDFTQASILSNWAVVYTRSDTGVESFSDLNGKKIAFMRDDISIEQFNAVIKPTGMTYSIIEASSYQGVFDLIEQEKADAGLVNNLFGLQHEDHLRIVKSPIICCPRELHFAVAKNNNAYLIQAIDLHLADFRRDKRSAYYQALEQWMGGSTATALPRWVMISLAVTLGLVFVLALVIALLRFQVSLRTSALTQINQGLLSEVAERKRAEDLLEVQKQVLELIAEGATLSETLNLLVERIEALAPGMLGSILLLDEDGIHFRHGAAPSLPAEYTDAIDGLSIGPSVGSCGTAAYRKEAVIVADIGIDPLWADYKAVALPHGLRACWSTPILDATQKRVLGTFAMYFRTPGLPQAEHQQIIGSVTHIAAVAINRHREAMALRKTEVRFRNVFELANDGIYVISADNHYLDANTRGLELLGYTREALLHMRLSDVLVPDDVARLAVETPRIMAGTPLLAEWQHRRKDGVVFPGEVSARRLEDNNYLAIVRDLTERRRAEEALREGAARLRLATEAGGIGLWDWNLQNNSVYFSSEWKRQIGYRDEEISDHYEEWQSRLHPDDLKSAPEKVRAFIDNPTGRHEAEFRFRHKDGSYRWIHTQANLLHDADGRPLRMVGCHIDITERKRVEQALRESEAKLRLFVQYAPSAIAMLDRDMCYVAYSHRWSTDYGLGDQVLTGRSHYEVFPDLPEQWKDIHRRCLTGATERRDEDAFPREDGGIDWVRWEIHPWRTSDGDIGGIIIFSEVITERKEAEIQVQRLNRFYVTLSQTNEAIVRATDVDSLFRKVCEIAVNDAGFLLAWVAATEGDSVVVAAAAGPATHYLDDISISVRADLPEGQGPTGRTFRSGENYICNDFLLDPAFLPWQEKASRFGFKASASFALKRAGSVVAVLNVYAGEANIFHEAEVRLLGEMAQDISFALDHLQQQEDLNLAMVSLQQAKQDLEARVRQRTAELEVAKERAEQADKLKSAFLATMSHELRTPLNSIIGFTNMLLKQLPGPLNDKQAKHMGIVKSASLHLLALINDVLDIAKVEAGELKLERTCFNLNDFITRIGEAFAVTAQHRGLDFSLQLNCTNITLDSDARRIEQVLNNFLSNAIKFTPAGQVTLGCEPVEAGVLISVWDTGIGIKAEDMNKLFQPFSQIKTSLEDAHGGTGLGLAISKHLVEAMGGRVSATSEWGKGSCFSFTLPNGVSG